MKPALGVLCVVAALLGGCRADPQGSDDGAWDWQLPSGWPEPIVPDDNPMSAAKVDLGRRLFHDTRLSVTGEHSCASCHDVQRAFTDGLAQAVGATGEQHPRGAMTNIGVAYATSLGWANKTLRTLEDQAMVPMFGTHPVELGLTGIESQVVEALAQDPQTAAAFDGAFAEEAGDDAVVSTHNITKALAAYQRSLISSTTRFDEAIYGRDPSALSDSERRGMALFNGERFECFHCHGGFTFTEATMHVDTAFDATPFRNNGLYNVDGLGAYPLSNQGLIEMTGNPRDMGRFKAPTLRNIALTAPYMHDGSIATLGEVLDHYARGGRIVDDGDNAGDGALSPLRDGLVRGFAMSPQERADVIAFLESLTDEALIAAESARIDALEQP